MTKFEQLAAAFPLHIQRIAEACYQRAGQERLDKLFNDPATDSPGGTLAGLIYFDGTAEGHAYWWSLATATWGCR